MANDSAQYEGFPEDTSTIPVLSTFYNDWLDGLGVEVKYSCGDNEFTLWGDSFRLETFQHHIKSLRKEAIEAIMPGTGEFFYYNSKLALYKPVVAEAQPSYIEVLVPEERQCREENIPLFVDTASGINLRSYPDTILELVRCIDYKCLEVNNVFRSDYLKLIYNSLYDRLDGKPMCFDASYVRSFSNSDTEYILGYKFELSVNREKNELNVKILKKTHESRKTTEKTGCLSDWAYKLKQAMTTNINITKA